MLSILFFMAGIAALIFAENLINHTAKYNPRYQEPGNRRTAAARIKGAAAFLILFGLVLLLNR